MWAWHLHAEDTVPVTGGHCGHWSKTKELTKSQSKATSVIWMRKLTSEQISPPCKTNNSTSLASDLPPKLNILFHLFLGMLLLKDFTKKENVCPLRPSSMPISKKAEGLLAESKASCLGLRGCGRNTPGVGKPTAPGPDSSYRFGTFRTKNNHVVLCFGDNKPSQSVLEYLDFAGSSRKRVFIPQPLDKSAKTLNLLDRVTCKNPKTDYIPSR